MYKPNVFIFLNKVDVFEPSKLNVVLDRVYVILAPH